MTPATLRAWRETHGLTRQDAANLLGMSRRTLETIEQGRKGPGPLSGPISVLIQVPLPVLTEIRDSPGC
jgi:transcriptional regulator with XRE-family HTH domain